MSRRSVVVTGASTGIGRATVDRLVRDGVHVWAAVRREEDERDLSTSYAGSVTPIRLDLTDHDSVRAAGEKVCAEGPLLGLVNNAGIALPGPLEFLPIEVFRRQLDVNLVGQLLMTQVMLPALRAPRGKGGGGRIVMIGSIGGRIATGMTGAYHSAKFGLVGLSDSLRVELAPFGVRVILIEPGSIATPIWKRGAAAAAEVIADLPPEAGIYSGQIAAARASAARTSDRGIPPERAADVIVAALTDPNPRPRQLVGRDAKAAATMVRLLPHRLLYRLTARAG